MEYLLTGKQMKELDRGTIERTGIPSMVLMERASLAVTEEIVRAGFDLRAVLVVCGSGNNGGDGFAAARLLREKGAAVTLAFVGKDASMTEECRKQRQICENLGMKPVSNFMEAEYTVIVDAIFGIGLSRPVAGPYEQVIDWMNRQTAVRVAVDIPSGVCADTGRILGSCVRADLTVTFAARKLGQVLYPGADCCGKLLVRQIGIGVPDRGAADFCFTFGPEDLSCLPARRAWSNKGSYGRVLLVAGAEGMSGAACLCARAAYRSGCGLVRVLTPECNRTVLQIALPEAIVTAYRDEEEGVKLLRESLEWADVAGIGPGTGTGSAAQRLLAEVLRLWEGPLAVDADGLNLLAGNPELLALLAKRRLPAVLTPHVAEMARLTGKSREAVAGALLETCVAFAGAHRLVCVEKDARTVVSDGVRTYVNTSGNSGMATGGSGDVLTGVICGLLAQGMDPFAAASLGVYVHGCAGDCARSKLGAYAMLAGDIADCIADVTRQV